MSSQNKQIKKSFTGYIYKITNVKTNKIYIGQTTNLDKRTGDHFRMGSNKKESTNYLHRSMKKYGVNNFKIAVILSIKTTSSEYLTKALNSLEIIYISLYDSYNNGYNCTIGGGGTRGYTHSEEAIEAMSKSRIGIPLSEAHKKSLSLSHMGKPHFMSEETKIKIGIANKGRRPSDECIKKVVERCNKPVIQYDINRNLIAEFPSVTQAATHMGCTSASISYACTKHKKIKNYFWEYKNITL